MVFFVHYLIRILAQEVKPVKSMVGIFQQDRHSKTQVYSAMSLSPIVRVVTIVYDRGAIKLRKEQISL